MATGTPPPMCDRTLDCEALIHYPDCPLMTPEEIAKRANEAGFVGDTTAPVEVSYDTEDD